MYAGSYRNFPDATAPPLRMVEWLIPIDTSVTRGEGRMIRPSPRVTMTNLVVLGETLRQCVHRSTEKGPRCIITVHGQSGSLVYDDPTVCANLFTRSGL